MTVEPARFATSVRSCWGIWPSPPASWSYSSLQDLEACPRRWMLSRATYPELWKGRGYPPMPNTAALLGDVVHTALELLVKALVAAGCESTGTAAAVAVLKQMGGYTAVIERALHWHLRQLEGNPRVNDDRLRRIRVELDLRIPDARAKVQAFLSRTDLPPVGAPKPAPLPDGRSDDQRPLPRGPLPIGAHAEVELKADRLRLRGRIDLLIINQQGVNIIDYKTGEPDPAHAGQLRTYALLWDLDRVANPARLSVTALTATYPAGPQTYVPPGEAELRTLDRDLRERIGAADATVAAQSPDARPSPENCQYCPVRHLCEDYWSRVAPGISAVRVGDRFDYQGVVALANGARSWAMDHRPGEPAVLLRTSSPSTNLRVGDHVRVLGVRRDEDPESGVLVAEMTTNSESFVLEDG